MFFKFKCLKRIFLFSFFGGMYIMVALRLQSGYYGRPQTWDPKMEPKWKWSRNDGGNLENNEKQWEYRISRRKPSPPVMFKFKCLKRFFFFGGMCILWSPSDSKVIIMVALRLRFQSVLWSPLGRKFQCSYYGRPQTSISVRVLVALRFGPTFSKSVLWSPSDFQSYYGRPQTWDPKMEPKWKWSRNDGGSLENNEKQWEYWISRKKHSPPVMFFKFKCLKRIFVFFFFFFGGVYIMVALRLRFQSVLWSPLRRKFQCSYYGRPQTSISVRILVALRFGPKFSKSVLWSPSDLRSENGAQMKMEPKWREKHGKQWKKWIISTFAQEGFTPPSVSASLDGSRDLLLNFRVYVVYGQPQTSISVSETGTLGRKWSLNENGAEMTGEAWKTMKNHDNIEFRAGNPHPPSCSSSLNV